MICSSQFVLEYNPYDFHGFDSLDVCVLLWLRVILPLPRNDHFPKLSKIQSQIITCCPIRNMVQFSRNIITSTRSNNKVRVICVFRQQIVGVECFKPLRSDTLTVKAVGPNPQPQKTLALMSIMPDTYTQSHVLALSFMKFCEEAITLFTDFLFVWEDSACDE